MYGALVDQAIFEQLVKDLMPSLYHSFKRNDMNLSLVSLPWFLSLYINSMPFMSMERISNNEYMCKCIGFKHQSKRERAKQDCHAGLICSYLNELCAI